jgi:signal peptidase I
MRAYNQAALELLRSHDPAGRSLRLRVISQSMSPFLKIGDTILVVPVASLPLPSKLRRGDVIVVWRSGDLVTHRLVAQRQDGWFTKGDRNRYMDAPVSHQSILGKVIAIDRDGRVRRMDSFPQSFVNRLLGIYGWFQAGVFSCLRWIRRLFFS